MLDTKGESRGIAIGWRHCRCGLGTDFSAHLRFHSANWLGKSLGQKVGQPMCLCEYRFEYVYGVHITVVRFNMNDAFNIDYLSALHVK